MCVQVVDACAGGKCVCRWQMRVQVAYACAGGRYRWQMRV